MSIQYNLFPNAKTHCLTMSFDDGRLYDRQLIALFNKYHIKGTFHLNSGKLDQPGYISSHEVSSLYDGHEVSCHTKNHPHLTQLPKISVIQEILEDKAYLESLVGYPVRGISSPFGDYNDSVIDLMRDCGMEYHRTVKRTYQFKKPDYFMEWHPTHHLRTFEKELFDQFFENPFNEMKILYLWGHSYEFNDQNNWDELEEVCAYLGNKDNVWYATNIQLKDYLDALSRLVISANQSVAYNPSALDVWITVHQKAICIPSNHTVTLY